MDDQKIDAMIEEEEQEIVREWQAHNPIDPDQMEAYMCRDRIRTSDRVAIICTGATNYYAEFQMNDQKLVIPQPTTCSPIEKGDIFAITCLHQALGVNGYGEYVDYVFSIAKNDEGFYWDQVVVINGPDAQGLLSKKTGNVLISRDGKAMAVPFSEIKAGDTVCFKTKRNTVLWFATASTDAKDGEFRYRHFLAKNLTAGPDDVYLVK